MPKKRKRIPNPLFEKWLEELRDEAQAEKNKPRYYSYCKVRNQSCTCEFIHIVYLEYAYLHACIHTLIS